MGKDCQLEGLRDIRGVQGHANGPATWGAQEWVCGHEPVLVCLTVLPPPPKVYKGKTSARRCHSVAFGLGCDERE